MSIKDAFNIFKPSSRRKPISPEEREKLKYELQNSIIEAETQRKLFRQGVERSIAKARTAIANNDSASKAIAFNELSMSYTIYRYMGAMSSNLRLMESNLAMQAVTENFANLVRRFSTIKVPKNSMDMKKLLTDALRGIQPVDLEGIENLTKGLLDGVMGAVNTTQINDQFLEDLVSGRKSIDDPIAVAPVTPQQVTYTAPVAPTQPAPAPTASTDVSTDDLMRMVDMLSSSLKNGG